MEPLRRFQFGIAIAFAGFAPPLAAQALPDADVSWTAEHLPESLQDSRLLTLPWPSRELTPGEWQRTVDVAWQSVSADLAGATGPLFAGGATWARNERLGFGGFAFYDRVTISGGASTDLLRSSFSRPVPLALPAFARFDDPRGEVRHWGAGGDAVWQRRSERGSWRRTLIAGAYFERLDVVGFRFEYELLSGADAGARGTLDWSGSYDFITPFAGIGWTRSLGKSWTMTPRLIAGQPLPRQRVAAAISGPGFSVEGEGNGAAMGDGYLGGGLLFEHLPSGIALDIGSSLWYAATEGLTHEGLDSAILVHVSWSF